MAWDIVTCATVGSAAFAGVSAAYAAFSAHLSRRAMLQDQRTQTSQLVLQQAELSLQWAWEALTDHGKNLDPPEPDRLKWLTAARHIERYKELKAALTEGVHKSICEDREEFWRHRFYQGLSNRSFLQPAYFQTTTNLQNGIEPTSVVVVFAFTKWPAGKADPLDAVDVQKLIDESTVLDGKPGLRFFLESKGIMG